VPEAEQANAHIESMVRRNMGGDDNKLEILTQANMIEMFGYVYFYGISQMDTTFGIADTPPRSHWCGYVPHQKSLAVDSFFDVAFMLRSVPLQAVPSTRYNNPKYSNAQDARNKELANHADMYILGTYALYTGKVAWMTTGAHGYNLGQLTPDNWMHLYR
jgi:hypothetical protein